MIEGTAGAMEALMWLDAKGRPGEGAETAGPGAFETVSHADLKARLKEGLEGL